MSNSFAVLGVGNMARAIIAGIVSADINVSEFFLYDKFAQACKPFENEEKFVIKDSITSAVEKADCVLISVKPQNYAEVLNDIKSAKDYDKKLYISIGAGITSESVSNALNGANVIRVLPNLPMTIGQGVSVICRNEKVLASDFDFVNSVFSSSGSTLIIDEKDMNATIGVTSSSPAYVFKFIDAIYKGAISQGISTDGLINAICDVFIGSAMLLKQSGEAPEVLISKVASKGGTTEKALAVLEERDVDGIISDAMTACTKRADELGNNK